MAYKFSKGSRGMGDITFEDDSDTGIDFEADTIKLETAGNEVLVVAGSLVGIGTSAPDYTLDVAGNIGVDQYIYHNGDANTYLNFLNDRFKINVGGVNYIDCDDSTAAPHNLTINDGGNNIDFIIKGNGSNQGDPLFKTDASTGRVGINGVGSPDCELHVDGDIKATGIINAKQRSITSHKYTYTNGSDAVFVRFNAAGSNTSGGVNNNFIAPVNGRLLKVLIRTDSTPGNTEIALCKITNGTGTLGAGSPSADVMINVSTANTTYIADFSGLSSPHDITFSEGNVLGIRINPTSNHGNVDITVVWEFDWNT